MTTKSAPGIGGHVTGLAATTRTDRWWQGPALTFCGFGAFILYSTWAAFQGEYYWVANLNYLSPMYSPLIFADSWRSGAAPFGHGILGSFPSWWPKIFASPAFLILMFPGAFRFTCYYYRKAYYRSFVATPPACAVGALPRKYNGERYLLLFQNLHRYALYAAIIFIFILTYDAFAALFDANGKFGVGVGTLVMFMNAGLLASYTFGCHSWRHLVGGRLNCFSCDELSKKRYAIWKRVSWLNERHMKFAWASLFWVGFTDFYIRMVSMGVINDLNTWGY